MANNSFKVKKSLNIAPIASPTTNEAGDIAFDSGTSSLVLNDGASTKALITDSAAQTLTNKTIDAASNTVSNIDLSMTTLPAETALDLATSNTDSTINIGTGSGTNTINIGGADTSINLIGNVFSQDVTDLVVTDKLITINDGGAAGSALGSGIEVEEAGVITASVKVSTDRNSWELKAPNTTGIASLTPGATNDTVTLNAATQVLTNKDIDGGTASNARRITLPKDSKTNLDALTRKQGTLVYDTTTNKPYYDDGSVLKVIGSGSGGAKNYIEGGDAEAGTTGWATYADAAGTRPVDGIGGTANVTWTTTSTTPLAGSNSFLFTKDAANRQGQGVAYNFTIDLADRARVLEVKFDYIVASGTFAAGSSSADSDVIVYLYDVTNARLIEPSSFKLFSNSSTTSARYSGYFQTSADSSSYRVILHVASTSASAYTLEIDDIAVTPSQYVYGTPITDWQSYTPTFTNFGTATSVNFIWRRVGDSVQIRGNFVAGITAAGEARISLPSVISRSTLPTLSVANGKLTRGNATTNNIKAFDVLIEPSVGYVTFGIHEYALNIASLAKRNGDGIMGSGETASLYAEVPVQGWSSSVQMSDSADTRVVSFQGTQVSQALTANVTNLTLTAVKDSHGAWDGDEYIVPVAGDYIVNGGAFVSGLTSFIVYFNGASQGGGFSTATAATYISAGSITIANARAGDRISIRSTGSITATNGNFGISRISGPSAIAATETIAASYYASVNKTSSTTQPIDYDTREFDTHNAVTTGSAWKFTAPARGLYRISGVSFSSTASRAIVYKNNVAYKTIGATATSTNLAGFILTSLYLNAGDFIDIRSTTSNTVLGGALGTTLVAAVNIERIGL